MIRGAHVIVYSKDAGSDLAFLRDVLAFPHVDAGHGWLIFALPPAEVAVHPADENDRHSLYLMCDDLAVFMAEMKRRNIECAPVSEQRWGSLTSVSLPGGGQLGVYQPKHRSPAHAKVSRPAKKGASTSRSPAVKKPSAVKRAKLANKKPANKKPAAKRRAPREAGRARRG